MILKARELRTEMGISQEKLAKMANISRATLSKIESGEDVSINSTTLLSLAHALGTTVDGIVCYTKNV